MSVAVPVYELPLLEYRAGLDAACAWLADSWPPLTRLGVPALQAALVHRVATDSPDQYRSGLWIEPQQGDWPMDLAAFQRELPSGARLAVLLARLPARYLPERGVWGDRPLGFRPGGYQEFRRALAGAGFWLETAHGFHSGQAVLLNMLAGLTEQMGRPSLVDRLGFLARLHYIKPLSRAWMATCALLLARKS